MGAPSIKTIFRTGVDILSVQRDDTTNTILAQIGNVSVGDVVSDEAEVWQHVGLCSLPSKVQNNQDAAQGIVINRGDRDILIASRDIRGQSIYGQLKEGETCLYATGADGAAQGRVLIKQDGSVFLYTTDSNKFDGKGVYLKVSPTSFGFFAPWGKMVFDATGFHVTTASGARLDLGGMGGLPGPLSSLASYANLKAAIVTLNGSAVRLGQGPAYMPAIVGPVPTTIATPGLPSTTVAVST